MTAVDLYTFTVTMTHEDLEALARGVVPPEVQNLIISLLIDVRLNPGDALESMTRRRRRATK